MTTTKNPINKHEHRLSLAIEASGVGIFDHSVPIGPDTYICDRCLQVFGYQKEELPPFENLLEWIFEKVHLQDVDRLKEKYAQLIQAKIPRLELEVRIIHKSGQWRHVRIHSKAMEHGSIGQVTRLIWVVKDITDQKAVEKELRRSESSLAEAQRIAHLGNWDWDITNNHLYWSDEIYRIFGLTTKQFDATYQAFLSFVHPNDRDKVKTAVNRALNDRLTYNIVHRIILPDGTVRKVHERAEVTFDDDGKAVRMLGTVQDITELSQVYEQREHLIAAIEAAGEAIIVTDRKGIIQYVNSANQRVTGFTAEERIGKDLQILDSNKQNQALFQDQREALTKHGVWRGRIPNNKKDGTPYQEDCTISTVKDEKGEIVNYVVVKRDVTDQLRLESMSEAINVADNIGYVFSGIRHEIGNPVNSIRMTLSMLRSEMENEDNKPAAEFIRRCMEELSRIQYLLNSLKNFSMFEYPNIEKMNIRDFMEKFESLIISDLNKQGISFKVDIETQAEFCLADPRALQQVLLNIVTNAMDAVKENHASKISVKISKDNKGISIQVTDNGCGMTLEQQQKLFRPFQTSKPNGTGLGLVIARRMLAKMSGFIEVSSQRENGTTVTIGLPS